MSCKKILIFLLTFFIVGSFFILEETLAETNKAKIQFFYSKFCHYCAKEEEFLEDLEKKYPEVEIKRYEIIDNPENQKLLQVFFEKYQVPEKERGVPVTITPNKYFIGFNKQIANSIESCLKECLGQEETTTQTIDIPFFGSVDLSKMSLPVLTITIGALDGLNPCAMWVLLFLIAILINIRSRKRMWLIAGTFLLASGIVYYLILAAWLNFFMAVSYVNLTRILIGAFALGIGIWQIKNFITYRPGVCRVINGKMGLRDKIKNGLRNHTEKVALSPLTFGILIGVILLALGINLIEFFCSAGLPAIYTRILALNQLNPLSYYLYLLLYTFIFMLDDLIIFSLAVITLSRINVTEKYNYWATLVGGLLIFVLGILLIFKPEFLMFG